MAIEAEMDEQSFKYVSKQDKVLTEYRKQIKAQRAHIEELSAQKQGLAAKIRILEDDKRKLEGKRVKEKFQSLVEMKKAEKRVEAQRTEAMQHL